MAGKVALVNALLVDGTGGAARRGMSVLLDGERIEEVGSRREFEPTTEVIDLEGRALLPGLVDCHVHFALWSLDLFAHADEPISYLAAQTFRALADALRDGCTAARDPGGLDTGFRDAVNEGLALGPRLQTSVSIISPINGIADAARRQGVPVSRLPGMPDPECTGPAEARAKVREMIRAGADFIKIAATAGISSARREPRQRLFTRDELAAIVDEAHAWGRPVVCHALGGPGVLMAIEEGVDTIEHGVWLDDDAVREMATRGTWYVPTLSSYELRARNGSPLEQSRAQDMLAPHRDSVRRAREAGVRIACGTDGGVSGHDVGLELELLVAAAMPASEAIAAATSRAAECLGWQNEIGVVGPGMNADLLIVNGDPTSEIGLLRRPEALGVVKSGRFVTPIKAWS